MESLNIEKGSPSNLDINDNNINQNDLFFYERSKKNKCGIPFIIYILILTFIIFLILIITLIIVNSKYKEHYIFQEDIYTKPQISEHNYSRILFNNNIEIILTQVHFNDTAGGALSFENGYLDLRFEPGFLKLALLCLRKNDANSLTELNDYMGDLKFANEEFYSTLYFTILNSGFQKFLKNFKEYTSYDENNRENLSDIVNQGLNRFNMFTSTFNDVNEREKYLVEYLVYNIKNKTGGDINRQGTSVEVNKTLNNNYTKIADIMDELFTNKKTKLIFFSHYKRSLMKKYILRYLHKLTVHQSKYENKTNKKEYTSLNTGKIIYQKIEDSDKNYIKINYYISNENINLSQLYIDSGYFYYLKYILDETNNNSLYYNLTHPNNNSKINIKSLSCNFEVVLKSRIKFTITVMLNHYSYNHIKEIITIIYEYMEKIKYHINNLKPNDSRLNELLKITKQNFSFTEDTHSGEFYKQKAEDLFYKNERDNFLKDVWLPSKLNNLNINENNISFYINQLTKKNSVIIVGINDKTRAKYNLDNSGISQIFKNIKHTNYFNINYSIHNISDIIKNNNNYNDINNNLISELKYHPNEFISNFDYDYKVPKVENNHSGKYESIDDSNNLVKFFWIKDTSFQLPKVSVVIYLFHPYQRPNFKEQKDNDLSFFYLMLYLSYMQRQINLVLADAIRAGTFFKLGYAENYLYLDIKAFSDKIEKILTIVKDKVINVNYSMITKDIEIYKDFALENFLDFSNRNIKSILKHEYSIYLTNKIEGFPPIYNYYNMKKENFDNFKINEKLIQGLKVPILYAFIMGYCEKEEIMKLYNIYKQDFKEAYFKFTLGSVDYNENITVDKYINTCLLVRDSSKKSENMTYPAIQNNMSYSFMKVVEFSDYSRIPVEIFRRIIQEYQNANFTVEILNQKNIYLTFNYRDNYTFEEIKESALKILNESKYNITKNIDIFGGRFYYLLRNIENEYVQTPNDLFNAAVDLSFNQLYERDRFDTTYKFEEDDYDNFTNTIVKFFNNNPNYFQVFNKKKPKRNKD